MKLSVVTINYNNKVGLEKTIASVLGQTEKDLEYIVIDGGSSDGSAEVVKKHADKFSYSVSEKDGGIFNAQNKGAQKAKGDYLLFLNSGDILANENVLKDFSQHLGKNQLVFGDLLVDDGKSRQRADMPDKLDVYYFMVSSLAHPSTFISSALYKKLGGYREDLKITGDYEFFLRAVLVHEASYMHISQAVAVFDTDGVSSDPAQQEKQRTERKKCWELNFSKPAIEGFEEYTRLLRSSELKVGKLIRNILNPFKAK